jgi:hypothetical protein
MSGFSQSGNSVGSTGLPPAQRFLTAWLNSRRAAQRLELSNLRGLLSPDETRACGRISRAGSPWRKSFGVMCAAAVVLVAPCFSSTARGQQPGETRIPTKLGKIRGGDTRQAFTGEVQSVDKKLKVLNMKSEKGPSTEIFPLKKNVDVQTLNGDRRTLSDLKPGANIMIYYEFKGSVREIKKIVVLSQGTKKEVKKKSAPPS